MLVTLLELSGFVLTTAPWTRSLSPPPFYGWRNRGLEKLSNRSKVAQGGGAGI